MYVQPHRGRRRAGRGAVGRRQLVLTAGLWFAAAVLSGCAVRRPLVARGLAPARTTAQELASALEPRRVALVVGVDSYRDPALPQLRWPGADAEAFAGLLSGEEGGFDEVRLLSGKDKTSRKEVLDTLRAIATPLRAQDALLVYFSGHGAAQRSGGGVSLYLLPEDTSSADLDLTAIDLAVLRTFLAELPVERKALLVDACFNGVGKSAVDPELRSEIGELLETLPGQAPERMSTGEIHLYATTAGRPAFEDEELEHGVYTYYLLQAMSWARRDADVDEDGVVTAYEAHDYARWRTVERTHGVQIPEASLRTVGMNDLVLVGDEDSRSVRERALVYSYGGGPWSGGTLLVDGRPKGLFPGTVSASPGRHHVELRDGDGRTLFEGMADLVAGSSVPLRRVADEVRESRVLAELRLGYSGGPGDAWDGIWRDGSATLAARLGLRRVRSPLRGLTLAVLGGAGLVPAGKHSTELPTRGMWWLGVEPGWSGGRGRWRARMGWQGRTTVLPAVRWSGTAARLDDAEAGWLLFSMGPEAGVGYRVGGPLSMVGALGYQLSVFAVEVGGVPRPHGWFNFSVGLEVSL